MADVSATFGGAECNGDSPLEHDQQPITNLSDGVTDVDSRDECSREDLPTKGNQEEGGKSQGSMQLSLPRAEDFLKGTVFSFLCTLLALIYEPTGHLSVILFSFLDELLMTRINRIFKKRSTLFC